MRNLICMTWGFSLPFFSSWKSQVASIIYTSLRLFLFSTLLPPSFFALHLPFSLLAIWLLQLCSLAYCRMCRCHQKLFTFQRFDAVSHVHKLHCRHFAQPLKQKQRDKVSFYLKVFGGGHNGTSFSLMFPLILIHPNYIIHHVSQRFFGYCDADWWSVSSQPRFK